MTYQRKTADEYTLQGFYSGSWEDLTAEETRAQIREQLKTYRENEPGTPYRIIKRRIKLQPANV